MNNLKQLLPTSLRIARTVNPDGVTAKSGTTKWNGFNFECEPASNTIKRGGLCLGWKMDKVLDGAREVLGNG